MDTKEKNIHRVDIPVELDEERIIKLLRTRKGSSRLEQAARELIEIARGAARPKALYQVSHPHVIDGDTVDIDGTRFTSRILSRCLTGVDTVYPFIATAGRELDELPVPPGDLWRQLCLDTVKTVLLVGAVDYLSGYINEHFSIPHTSHMNPGEIEDWPLSQQLPLFRLFDGTEKDIGVTLSKSGVMKPVKSRSGILFPDDTGFVSCRFCTQSRCPGRSAAYDPALVKEYLGTGAA